MLCGHLGMTMRHLADTMSAAEYDLWVEDYPRNPWGHERGDMQAATVASTIANANAAKGKTFKLSDFIPKFGAKVFPSPEELKTKALGIFRELVKRTK